MTAPDQTVDTTAPEVSTTVPDNTPAETTQPSTDENQGKDNATPPNEGEKQGDKSTTEPVADQKAIDEAELEAIINSIVKPTDDQGMKFSFKEDKKPNGEGNQEGKPEGIKEPNSEANPGEKKILDELTQAAEIYSQENKTLTLENQNLKTTVDSERTAKEEAIAISAKVDELWKGVAKDLPIIDQYADALSKGEPFELPPIYRPEIQQKLQDHPIVGPLNRALMAGEELPIADFVKALAEHRRSTAPQMADAKNSVSSKQTTTDQNQSKLALHGVKTVRPF